MILIKEYCLVKNSGKLFDLFYDKTYQRNFLSTI